MEFRELKYLLAFSLIKNLGPVNAKKILEHFGEAEMIFREKTSSLHHLRIGRHVIEQIKDPELLKKADGELAFISRNKIGVMTISDQEYPYRLKQCQDAPLILYRKGKIDLNCEKVIAVVGTRLSTKHGKSACEELIKNLSELNLIVISGLAIGIDAWAHRFSLKYDVKTAAVVGHSLNRLYPFQNKQLFQEIERKGALISEFPSTSTMVPGNFPSRNRIIAGLSDATVVVESDVSGGSLITAELANSYDREVFTFPGKPSDKKSRGCNWLIKTNKAGLIENAIDLIESMSWKVPNKKTKQTALFTEFTPDEKQIVNLLSENNSMRLDEIATASSFTINRTSTVLLGLEMKNVLRSLPGNIYELGA